MHSKEDLDKVNNRPSVLRTLIDRILIFLTMNLYEIYINLFAKDKKCRYKLNNRTNKNCD